MDELGIVAAIKKGSNDYGIVLLNFLPACNNCKRMSRVAKLKKCSRCKLVTYCGKDCQAADWDPHHKMICKKGSGPLDLSVSDVKLFTQRPVV